MNVVKDERDGDYYHATVEEGLMGSMAIVFLDPRDSTLFINDGDCDSIQS